ncbi:MAG: glycerophosphodiester phosphodiesterase family protein, partial [Gammaproteobacteria bacterium]
MTLDQAQFVAHRGYAARYPENTEVALTAAVRAGARYVEIDVQLTADGVAVLFHDRSLERLCGRAGAIHQLQSEALAELKVSDRLRFSYRYAQNPIMTLQQFCAWLSQRPQVTAFVELKRISLQQFGAERVLHAVVPLLTPLQAQVVLISYDLEVLAEVRRGGQFPIGAVFDDWGQQPQAVLAELKPEFLFCDWQTLPRRGRVRNPWGQLAVYECTDPAVAQRLSAQGVDLIETFAIG